MASEKGEGGCVIIDGKAIAGTIRGEIAKDVEDLSQKYGKVRKIRLHLISFIRL